MKHSMTSFWADFVAPMLRRPNALQVAALCYRDRKNGKGKEVLLITSRGTGRWIIPKGWPMEGLKSSEAALQEAWEEAGVREGKTQAEPIGSYDYDKTLDSGLPVPVTTLVYPVAVKDMSSRFPEAEERRRKWVSPSEAANMIDEPELQDILREL